MVAHIDSHKSAVDRRSEGDFGASSRELESVVQKVHHRPENLLPIGVYVQFGVDSDYGKRAAARLGEQVGSRGRIVYQSGQ